MSLWWVKKEQLDKTQISLIEKLPLGESFLVLGPPGSGKTNVLIRRAQFVRSQDMPNVMLLTFTRPLTEFVKTGCFDPQGREIFPRNCVQTLESWQRRLYVQHGADLPVTSADLSLTEKKRLLSLGALNFIKQKRLPRYDALFIDEAQDLLPEEVKLLEQWSPVLFFVGDDRQRIYESREGLEAVKKVIPTSNLRELKFHYRVAPEICRVADRILIPQGGISLESTSLYTGPKPATIMVHRKPLSKEQQLNLLIAKLKQQIRVYGDRIREGDRLGVIVARRNDRALVFEALDDDEILNRKSKIMRAREEGDDDYDPSFEDEAAICILTIQGCKGVEFRAVHWLFADDLSYYHDPEHYYTVVTRAKTSLDISCTDDLPEILGRAHSETEVTPW